MIELLRNLGSSSVTDLARHMGRPADSLYYHLRKLQSVGIVHQCGTRMNMGQSEAIYQLNGSSVELGDPQAESNRGHTEKLLSAILRMTDRATKQAFDEEQIVAEGDGKNFHARRELAWLTDEDLGEVNEHIAAIATILERSRRERRGNLYALTTFFMPIVTSADQRGRRLRPSE